jgi:hypothetical protein
VSHISAGVVATVSNAPVMYASKLFHGHSGFRERVLAIRAGEKRQPITESDANKVLPLCRRD